MIRTKYIKHSLNSWSILSFIFISLIIFPNLNILMNLINKPNENWTHIKTYLLNDYIINSMILVIFTGILTTIIGISLSWIISAYDFPGRKFFEWGLILPLAIPPYIAAYTYNGILDYTGVIQATLRNHFNIQLSQKYFDIMSMKGSIFIFTIFLFPYVYIITKSFLEKQSAALIENARLLGRSQLEIFIHVVLPISRASIIGGVSLVILEVLNDYGVVKFFGITTFSTAIFKTWFGMGDIDSAVRISAILLLIVFAILLIEKLFRGRKKYSFSNTKFRPITRKELKDVKGILAFLFCFAVFSLGFLIPTLQLAHWSLMTYKKILDIEFWRFTFSSLSIALLSAGLIIIIAIIIANYCRMNDNFLSKLYSKTTAVGYSIPGAVIAIAVIIFFIALDNKLFWLYKLIDKNSSKLVLSTSITMLIFAYIIRFLAIGFNSIESGFEKIGKKFSEASRTLGMNITETFLKVDFKMIKPSIISGFILVFVDILKELPLTLILRPFNFNTLATKSFEYANDEMIHEASVSSLIIIIISIISIYIFNKASDKEAS
ncbi:ABC transporter permease [Paramaledivibacter caminithermalis]|uniref:Iron(III) transport system permease protein n=1 Tax=Paramaledivibacter caminithermalis (strain DSM 15212 / CIP 107654 / DViRD3) TaxID=1121301 RepID=A0A1M6K3C2_PARC5|nr:iron ABC transporter permease [Paramaledivibacter caminithermalis]SHJ53426.1 iron(III) transport system permease protein [Paramaledivibacter caminithermalis DSM 15212]